jgi:hypothetical protein
MTGDTSMTRHAMRLQSTRFATLAMMLALAACATTTDTGRPAEGSIEGVIQHPGHVVPAMRICAIATDPARTSHCIATRAGDDTYRIDGLPAGEYQVFAEAARGLHRFGGHLQAVQCIRAPCPEQPKTIALAPGAMQGGIDLTFFDDARADFPALPSD